jgi:hypothetical protein
VSPLPQHSLLWRVALSRVHVRTVKGTLYFVRELSKQPDAMMMMMTEES